MVLVACSSGATVAVPVAATFGCGCAVLNDQYGSTFLLRLPHGWAPSLSFGALGTQLAEKRHEAFLERVRNKVGESGLQPTGKR